MSENMLFCLGDGKFENSGEGYQKNYRIFNKDVSKEVYEKVMETKPYFELPLAKWVDKKDMTAQEKKNSSSWEQTGGYLKVLSYEDSWVEGWKTASDEFKKWVKVLPNFNSTLFKEITGLDIEESLIGSIAEVTIGGKTYRAKIID